MGKTQWLVIYSLIRILLWVCASLSFTKFYSVFFFFFFLKYRCPAFWGAVCFQLPLSEGSYWVRLPDEMQWLLDFELTSTQIFQWACESLCWVYVFIVETIKKNHIVFEILLSLYNVLNYFISYSWRVPPLDLFLISFNIICSLSFLSSLPCPP